MVPQLVSDVFLVIILFIVCDINNDSSILQGHAMAGRVNMFLAKSAFLYHQGLLPK